MRNKVTPAATSFNVTRRYQTTRRETEGVEGGWNNPESFKSSAQYSLSLSFKVLYNLINRIKVIGQNRAKRGSFHIFCFSAALGTLSLIKPSQDYSALISANTCCEE